MKRSVRSGATAVAAGAVWGAVTCATGHVGSPLMRVLSPLTDAAWPWFCFPFVLSALFVDLPMLASAVIAAIGLATAGTVYSVGDFVAGETDVTGLVEDLWFWLLATSATGALFGLVGACYRHARSRIIGAILVIFMVVLALLDSGRRFEYDPRLVIEGDAWIRGGYLLSFTLIVGVGAFLLISSLTTKGWSQDPRAESIDGVGGRAARRNMR